MPRPYLTTLEKTAAIDLASATIDAHTVEFWLGPARGVLDETAITLAWLPGGGWTNRTNDVALSQGALINHDGEGHTITFTIVDESRTVWADDLAIAVIAQHYYAASSAFGARYLVAWGYLNGADRQVLGQRLEQTGQRIATYAGYWDKKPVDAILMGRRNLAGQMTLVSSSPVLAAPEEEAPLEYVSQDACDATKLTDGYIDTAAVLDVIADPAIPIFANMPSVRLFRAYGPFTRGVAAGGEPRFVELAFGDDLTPWGKTWTSIPDMYNRYSGEGQVAVRDEPGHVKTEVVTYGDGTKGFRITAYQNSNPTSSVWIQWTVRDETLVPFKWEVEVKAGATGSIGKRLHSLDMSDGDGQARQEISDIRVAQDWQKYEFDFDGSEHYGGGKFAITTGQGQALDQDFVIEIRNLRLAKGYSDQHSSVATGRLFFCYDNGAGVQGVQRIEFDLTGGEEDWKIPAFSSVIITDDTETFKHRFGDTGKTVYQLKNKQPEWFFAPGVGKMKLAYSTNPNRTNYSDPSLIYVDEIDFVSGGYSWSAFQSIRRGDGTSTHPLGTLSTFWSTEDFPHVGLLPTGGYGAGYWHFDLGAYSAPKLKQPMNTTIMRVTVDNIDAYSDQGFGKIGTERMWWIGKDGDTLLLNARHIDGTTVATHNIGDALIPDGWGGTFQNTGVTQTGWNVDLISLRRKPGTPMIVAGAVLYSNLVVPSNPSTGASHWERNADWKLLSRWSDRQGNPDVITIDFAWLGGPREMRHVCIVVDKMARDSLGNPQRVKLNEIVVLEAELAAGQGGQYQSKNASDLAGVLGFLLAKRADVPPAKIQVATQPNGGPIRTPGIIGLPIAPTSAGQAIRSIAQNGLLKVWLDAANTAIIDADPANSAYSRSVPYFVVDSSMLHSDLILNWTEAHETSQVRVTARDVSTGRVYTASYPSIGARLGKVREIRDIIVYSSADVFSIAESSFRMDNSRRRITIPLGALPWLEVGQFLVANFPEIDFGGNGIGMGVAVESYSIQIGQDEGGVTWETSVTLQELGV